MTYDPKLDLIFNTLDPVILRESIKTNYLVRRGITSLIDNISVDSFVTFDAINKEWREGTHVINTFSRTVLLSFPVAKLVHEGTLGGGCAVDYIDKFYEKIDKIVDAYTLAMIPVDNQLRIDQLRSDLAQLEQQQTDALDIVRSVSVIVEDDQLNSMKDRVVDKNKAIQSLNQTIKELISLQALYAQSPIKAIDNLWGGAGR